MALATVALTLGSARTATAQASRPEGDAPQALAAARAKLAAGELSDAEETLRDAIAKGREPELLIELARLFADRAEALEPTSDLSQSLRRGMLEEALALAREAAKAPAAAVDATLVAARCQTLFGDDEGADATMRGALEEMRSRGGPREDRVRLVKARVLFLAQWGRAEEALVFAQAAQTAGEIDAVGVELEKLRIASARHDRAQAAALAPAVARAGGDSFEVATLCWDANQDPSLEPMLSLYSRLIEARPNDVVFLYFRGVTRYKIAARQRLSDDAGAEADLRAAVGDARIGRRARYFLGMSLIRLGRAEQAREQFLAVLDAGRELVSECLDGLVEVAVDRARRRDFRGSLELYERVLKQDPRNLWACIGRPLCFRSLGEYEHACTAYEEGLAALPEEPQLLNDFALLRKAHGERKSAQELFERALGNGSGNARAAADAGENLGIIAYRDDHDLEAADRYFARTLLLDPTRPRIRLYRELCLLDRKRTQR